MDRSTADRGRLIARPIGDRPPRLPTVFNFSGSEMVFLLLLALIILGPDKLPDAIKKFGKTYAEFKKVSTGFQTELRSALDEPMREMRSTAEILKNATNFDAISDTSPPVTDSGTAATSAPPAPDPAPVNPYAVVPAMAMTPIETPPVGTPPDEAATEAAGDAPEAAGDATEAASASEPLAPLAPLAPSASDREQEEPTA